MWFFSGMMTRWGSFVLVGLLAVACQKKPDAVSELQGIVELDERALSFEIGGKVLAVNAERGQVLEAGDPVARLDTKLEELRLGELLAQARAQKAQLDLLYEGTRSEEIEQARAKVRGTRSTQRARLAAYRRAKSLYADDSVSEADLDLARGVYESAQALYDEAREKLEQLQAGPRKQEIQAGEALLDAALAGAEASRERIRRHVIHTSADTEVLDVPVKFGEVVAPGTTVATVADTAHPYVDTFVPQDRIDEVKMNGPASVASDALKEPLGGRVEHIGRMLEYSPRFLFSPDERPYLVLRVRVRIHDPQRKIRAGVPAFVTLEAPPNGAPLPPLPATSGQPPATENEPAELPAVVEPSGDGDSARLAAPVGDDKGAQPKKTDKKAPNK